MLRIARSDINIRL